MKFVLILLSFFFSLSAHALPINSKYYPVGKSYILPFNADSWTTLVGAKEEGQFFSPNGRQMVVLSPQHKLSLFDTIRGKVIDSNIKDSVVMAQFISDSEVLMTLQNGDIQILNTETFKIKKLGKFPWKETVEAMVGGILSPDHKTMVGVDASDLEQEDEIGAMNFYFLNLKNKKLVNFREKGLPVAAEFSSDGQQFFVIMLDLNIIEETLEPRPMTQFIVFDLNTNERRSMSSEGFLTNIKFSPDGKNILLWRMVQGKSSVRLVDSEFKEEKEIIAIPEDQMLQSAEWSKDGESILYSFGQEVGIIDLKTGDKKTWDSLNSDMAISQARFISNDTKILISEGFTLRIRDLKNETEAIIELEKNGSYPESFKSSPDAKTVVAHSNDGRGFVIDVEQGRVIRKFRHSDQLVYSGFSKSGQSVVTISEEGSLRLTSMDSVLVPERFDLTDDQAKQFLERFSSNQNFTDRGDVTYLRAALSKDLTNYAPEVIVRSLLKVLRYSNDLFEELVREFPEVLTMSQSVTAEWFQAESQMIEDYLNFLKLENPKKTGSSNWKVLVFFKPYFQTLTPEAKEPWIDYVAQSIADRAVDSAGYTGMFLSKLYKFSRAVLEPIFNNQTKQLTDLTLVREANQVTPFVLGTSAIEGDETTETPYGFFIKKIDPIVIPDNAKSGDILTDSKLKWTQGDEVFTADLRIAIGDKKVMIPEGKGPNYQELWRDKELVGMVITGSNLGSDAKDVLSEYLQYFRRMGFRFNFKEEGEVIDLPSFFKETVASGELDYFIKEAHSDGDEKNLFRMDKESKVLTGVHRLKNGTREMIYLVYPTQDSKETVLLPNSEFGSWIRDREKNGGGQIVYFNTSCWSVSKAVHEIEAASSLLFLNIPSTTSVETFTNEWDEAEYQLLTAFRFKKSYEKIRKAMEKDPAYKSGEEDVFIFPDEDAYQEQITKVIAIPLNSHVAIYDGAGNFYNIDEQH